jgi:HD-GYP domain-containing protein (c-di-GMP phosphodiesterase class II)
MRIVGTVFDITGKVLFKRGHVLDEADIRDLSRVVRSAYVVSSESGGLLGMPDMDRRCEKRLRIVRNVCHLFSEIYEQFVAANPKSRRSIPGLFSPSRIPTEPLSPSQLLETSVDAVFELVDEYSSSPPFIKRDPLYLFEHCVDTAILVAAMMLRDTGEDRSFRRDREYIRDMVRGSLLHEIGMLSVPYEVLTDPDLTETQKREYLLSHPKVGIDMALATFPDLGEVERNILLRHHERPDGSGYPNEGPVESCFEVELVGLASYFDALTSSRPQRTDVGLYQDDKSLSVFKALLLLGKESRRGSVSQQALQMLRATVPPYPVGATVLVDNGDLGVVVSTAGRNFSRPFLRCHANIDGEPRQGKTWDLDLSVTSLGVRDSYIP